MRFEVKRERKRLVFDSDLRGLIVGSKQYVSGRDGELIYDQTLDLKADEVELQMSSNTSTLIPALRLLSIGYHPYFDRRDVVESQNNITFYWNRSKLAAFYNRFSTDELDFPKREPIIREAVDFLANHTSNLTLKDVFLTKVLKPCKLLGFYQGFPVFDSSTGFAKLQSRLGIHIDTEAIMISTPLSKYEGDVYELAEEIFRVTGLDFSGKKNRVVFPKDDKILELLELESPTSVAPES